MRRALDRISPNLPEKILGHFLCEYFLMKTVLGAIFSNQTTLENLLEGIVSALLGDLENVDAAAFLVEKQVVSHSF